MFKLHLTEEAANTFDGLKRDAQKSLAVRTKSRKAKSTKAEGLFKQIAKTLKSLANNPKHPGLNTHEYNLLGHPFDSRGKVFGAYAQNNTPSAYRVFWCYGPEKNAITIIAITPHP